MVSDRSVRFPQSYLMCANYLALNSLLLDRAWLNVQSQSVPLNVALLQSLSRGLTRPWKMWPEVHNNKPHFPECYHLFVAGKLISILLQCNILYVQDESLELGKLNYVFSLLI